MDIREALKNLKIDFKTIEDENLRATIILLFTASKLCNRSQSG